MSHHHACLALQTTKLKNGLSQRSPSDEEEV